MTGKYTCPKEGCDYVQELFWADGDGIRDILAHEKEHETNTREVEKTERRECIKCEGKGYIEYAFIVDEDVPKTD